MFSNFLSFFLHSNAILAAKITAHTIGPYFFSILAATLSLFVYISCAPLYFGLLFVESPIHQFLLLHSQGSICIWYWGSRAIMFGGFCAKKVLSRFWRFWVNTESIGFHKWTVMQWFLIRFSRRYRAYVWYKGSILLWVIDQLL